MSTLGIVSQLLGWIYTLAWSLSFYPQIILNYRRRSTSGTTIDFPLINLLGFIAYFIYTSVFFYSSKIRAQYALRNHGLQSTVQFNDVAFAGHALVMCAVVLTQYFPSIWGFDKRGRRGHGARVSAPILGLAFGCMLGVEIIAFIVLLSPEVDDPVDVWAWIDVLYAISYTKMIITVTKYIPQVLTNYHNQSTHGWSILMILLDFTGGVLSIIQLGIDSYIQRDWSGITGNPIKLLLGNISIFFDVIFMVQHYVLYKGNDGKQRRRKKVVDDVDGQVEDDPLLDEDVERDERREERLD